MNKSNKVQTEIEQMSTQELKAIAAQIPAEIERRKSEELAQLLVAVQA